ncbi:hypothetical protein L2E82_51411 [Cichorium intybus]|nr:hypothetical protein L2E82_51411 [Cichorium intybus]
MSLHFLFLSWILGGMRNFCLQIKHMWARIYNSCQLNTSKVLGFSVMMFVNFATKTLFLFKRHEQMSSKC